MVSIDAGAFGGGEAAGALGEVTKTIVETAQKFENAQKVTTVNNAKIEDLKEVTNFVKGLPDRQDYTVFEKEFDDLITGIHQRRQEEIKDPLTRSAIQQSLSMAAIQNGVKVTEVARRKQTEFGKASYIKNMDDYIDLFATADEDERAFLIEEFVDETRNTINAGYINPTEGQNKLNEFLRETQKTVAHQDLQADPGNFNPDNYPRLKASDRISLDKYARRLAATEKKARIKEQQEAEKEVEKIAAQLIEESDYQSWQDFYNKDMSFAKLESLASTRQISEGTYRAIRDRMDKSAVSPQENNPHIVGELSEKVELGLDVRKDLKRALEKGEIKEETYITMTRQVTNKKYKRGLSFLSNAMKPTMMDKWNPDKNLRYAEAIEEWNFKINEGQDPVKAAIELVRQYTDDTRRTMAGLRKPMFLRGLKNDLAALNEAENATYRAWKSGRISDERYNKESELIRTLKTLADWLTDTEDNLSAEEKSELEERKKRSKKEMNR
ncbi:hypothetical protein KKA53_04950 [Candidatus Dependentiae bacterium]|nr:hypothetical protein [Candidatus Dependentiae bacterium]